LEARAKGAAYYRAGAEHCRRLAKMICDPKMERALIKCAQECDAEVLRLETEADGGREA
jgi:hypothetical protein